MSTKTTFKRVALVAVAALGLGVLTSVAPANATGRDAASLVIGSVPTGRSGLTSIVTTTIYLPTTAVENDTITVNAQIVSAPATGGNAGAASVLQTGDAGNNLGARLGVSASSSSQSNFTGTYAAASTFGQLNESATAHGDYNTSSTPKVTGKAASSGFINLSATDVALGYVKAYVRVTPDISGSYVVLVSTNATGATQYAAGHTSATFTLTTGSAPTGLTIASVGGSTILAGSPNGILAKITTVGGLISGNEVINLTTSGSGSIATGHTGGSFATTATLTSSNFSSSGVAWVRLKNTGTAAETISLTATGSGVLSSSVAATQTFSVVAGGSATAWTYEAPSADAVYASTSASETSDKISISTSATSASLAITNTKANALAATAYGYVTITDTAGLITGRTSAVYDQVFSAGAATDKTGIALSWTLSSATAVATDPIFTVGLPLASTTTLGVAAAVTKTFASVARTNSTMSISPTTTFLAAPGAAIALTATLKDQYGAARSGQTVTITTTGRNNPTATTAVTDASGKVTFTTADASTSTTALTDTVTFTAGSATKAATINYGNTAVGTVTVTGGNTTASVTAATVTTNDIAAGDGVEAGAISVTATVKDALGNALAGVPVTFTVAGTGVAFKSTSATVYTGATGTAAGSLYGWVAGTYTYTVTAGGKTTTGTATFGQSTATEARVISATAVGNVVTGKAVDRLGNPVAGVTLYASTTAPANIGGGFVATGTTAANGTVSWVVTGSGDVVVSAVNPASVAGTTFGQTCALAGNLTCAVPGTAATAFTASTTGTATTAETYVGATFAPAGVASVTVSAVNEDTAQAAADAAAEATDAANAATDAANAAAEAADAATAAAQDAADAVAALSTQVSEMVNALKKQITALTNLVIKIQKKVKA